MQEDGNDGSPPIQTGRLTRHKRKVRSKYTSKACDDCRSRKVKCCGKLPCRRCATRKIVCLYGGDANFSLVECIQSSVHSDDNDAIECEIETRQSHKEGSNDDYRSRPKRGRRSTDVEKGTRDCLTRSADGLDFDSTNETDTFEPDGVISDCRTKQPLSLQSKLAAICKSLSVPPMRPPSFSAPQSDYYKEFAINSQPGISLELPVAWKLHSLLQIFFSQFNPYFLAIDQSAFEARLLAILIEEKFNDTNRKVKVDQHNSSFLSLLSIVLALGAIVNPESENSVPSEAAYPRGWEWHLKSRQLRQLFRSTMIQNTDASRSDALESMYLVHTERLEESCESVARAIVSAQAIGLNDQATWPLLSPEEFASWKNLWWLIYYQDRKLAEKLGRPYILREAEVNVNEYFNQPPEDINPSMADTAILYMQTLVDWGRVWAQIWDILFSPSVRGAGSQEAVEALDLVVLQLQTKLPPCFSSRQETLFENVDDIPLLEDRLIFTKWERQRINLLRLAIRQNPYNSLSTGLTGLKDNQATAAVCASISRSIISSLVFYLTTHQRVNQMGNFATMTLVECICHLIRAMVINPALRVYEHDEVDGLNAARNLLLSLSLRLGTASRALAIIDPVVSAARGLREDQQRLVTRFDAILDEAEQYLWPEANELLNPWWSLTSGLVPFGFNSIT